MVPAICSRGGGGGIEQLLDPPWAWWTPCGCTRLNVAISLGALRTGVWVLSSGKTPIWRLGCQLLGV